MSELEKLMSILRKVHEQPEARDEFRLNLYILKQESPSRYEEAMAELKELQPLLHKEMADFVGNVEHVLEFLERVKEFKKSD